MMLDRLSRHGWLIVWFSLVVTAYLVRNIFPIDETRYLSVAWEMWVRNDFLLPYLNGELYSQKPPMLFWLFHLGWSVFGVNEWWPRLVPPLFALAGIFLTRNLARQMWPQQPEIATLVPWILIGCIAWSLYTTTVMFDMLLMAMVLLAIAGIWRAANGYATSGWILVGIASGLGLLIKGPVMMVHIFFPVILAPWWNHETNLNKRRWYTGFILASVLATLIAFCWLIPAISAGGSGYEQKILWHQSVGRAFSSFAHNRPFWWYVPLVPIILFPWLFWPPAWRALLNSNRSQDRSTRFLLSWIAPTFVLFSMISGKQVHYLIPLIPAVALLLAYSIHESQFMVKKIDQFLPALFIALSGIFLLVAPELNLDWMPALPKAMSALWGITIIICASLLFIRNRQFAKQYVIPMALVSSIFVLLLMLAIFPVASHLQNVTPIANRISQWQAEGRPIAHLGKYHGQFQFIGRLNKPLTVVRKYELDTWCESHPNAYVVIKVKNRPDSDGPQPEFVQRYRNQWLTVWSAADIEKATMSFD